MAVRLVKEAAPRLRSAGDAKLVKLPNRRRVVRTADCCPSTQPDIADEDSISRGMHSDPRACGTRAFS